MIFIACFLGGLLPHKKNKKTRMLECFHQSSNLSDFPVCRFAFWFMSQKKHKKKKKKKKKKNQKKQIKLKQVRINNNNK